MPERCQPVEDTQPGARQQGGAVAAQTPSAPAGSARIRPSKAGKWRALSLVLVHAVIAVHVAHWLDGNETVSPVEPSEAMQFSTRGVVNAGAIFFALTIASTLVLGRWFCGWACHVVALQDLCRWLLLKVGLRPRLVDLGPLRAVPWLAFVYMFLAPILARLLAGQSVGIAAIDPYTEDLWQAFPKTWVEALATIAVCGFVIVWLLGSKGFCTYGCPYGGIFGVVDQLAPVRIRVTDACRGCGHCSAVCSSNVNVAQEVRDHRMVVDPGCMKCLDCVSVCPSDALYVGFGKPALFAGGAGRAAAKPPTDWGRLALSAAFSFAALSVFLAYDSRWDPRFSALLWAPTFAVMLLFRGRARAKSEHTRGEEALIAVAFLAAMWCFRGLFDAVPFLFALGLSSILAWWSVQIVRLVRVPDVRLQRTALKRAGRWTAGGIAFAATVAPIGWLWQRGFAERRTEQAARARADAQHHARERAVAEHNRGVEAARAGSTEEAIAAFRAALGHDASFLEARENLAGMLCQAGRFQEGLEQFELALAQNPTDAETRALAAQACLALGRPADARRHLEEAVRIAPGRGELWRLLADVQEALGDSTGAHASRARSSDAGTAPSGARKP